MVPMLKTGDISLGQPTCSYPNNEDLANAICGYADGGEDGNEAAIVAANSAACITSAITNIIQNLVNSGIGNDDAYWAYEIPYAY